METTVKLPCSDRKKTKRVSPGVPGLVNIEKGYGPVIHFAIKFVSWYHLWPWLTTLIYMDVKCGTLIKHCNIVSRILRYKPS